MAVEASWPRLVRALPRSAREHERETRLNYEKSPSVCGRQSDTP